MSNRNFMSCFATDLDNMIDLMVAIGGVESTYLPRAKSFDCFCVDMHVEKAELTEILELKWLEPVMKAEPAIIHNRISFINGFAAYLNSIGKPAHILHNRFAAGRSLFVPYLFSDEELTRLFHVIDTNTEHGNAFQRTMFSVYFRLIYTCGLRPGEGTRLKRKDINLKIGEVLIDCSKKRKSRIVVMSDDMKELAKKYNALLSVAFPDAEFFFPSIHGNACPENFFQKYFRHFFALANPDIDPTFLPHVRVYDLRHRFATAAIHRWLDQGVDISSRLPYLQMYMGHNSVEHTAYYVHLLPENLIRSSGLDWESLGSVFPGAELWQN